MGISYPSSAVTVLSEISTPPLTQTALEVLSHTARKEESIFSLNLILIFLMTNSGSKRIDLAVLPIGPPRSRGSMPSGDTASGAYFTVKAKSRTFQYIEFASARLRTHPCTTFCPSSFSFSCKLSSKIIFYIVSQNKSISKQKSIY